MENVNDDFFGGGYLTVSGVTTGSIHVCIKMKK